MKSATGLQGLSCVGVVLEVLLKEGGDRATLLLRPGRHRVVAVQTMRAVGRGHVLRQRTEPTWRVIAWMDRNALAVQEDRHMICRGSQVDLLAYDPVVDRVVVLVPHHVVVLPHGDAYLPLSKLVRRLGQRFQGRRIQFCEEGVAALVANASHRLVIEPLQ